MRHVSGIFAFLCLALAARPERTPLAGAAELVQTLDRLNTLGSLLMIAAHPDDENTAVIAYFARGRHIRTAYLSATRGEGGQNLIGPEQSEALGLIRTQELLAARRIDGGEQYFTRAFDFGFSKSPEEALAKWGRELVVGDMVRVVRRFRPDVIVTRWAPQGGSGHGHHTATGHLTPEVWAAAADPQRFPEQIREGLSPWRARRLVWNVTSFNRQQEGEREDERGALVVDAGQYDFALGKSYAEIAAESRTQHASQGFGSAERKGPSRQYFTHVAGEPAKSDLFDGIDTTWRRVPGAERLGQLLARARDELDVRRPGRLLPLLLEAWGEMQRLRDPWVEVKRPELLHAIELAAGLQLEAAAERWDATPGSRLEVSLTALHHGSIPLAWLRAELLGAGRAEIPLNQPLAAGVVRRGKAVVTIPPETPYSQPYWLREERPGDAYVVREPALIGRPQNPPVLEAVFQIRAGDAVLPFRVPVKYRWVDRTRGEQERAVEVVPPVSVAFSQRAMIFPDRASRRVLVRVANHGGEARGVLSLDLPAGWKAAPAGAAFHLPEPGRETSVAFDVTPPESEAGGYLAARATVGPTAIAVGLVTIRHWHIPIQTLLPPARLRIERADVRMTARTIGYVMGAGDEVPQALEQLGAAVRMLGPEDLAAGDLSRFDAIVTGVRAVNVRDDLVAARARLLEYVWNGGTLVVQYNTAGGFLDPEAGRRAAVLAPYPLTPSSIRVTVEEAPVTFPNPEHPLLNRPNKITPRDFEGWVQERGLYFMSSWDERYQPLLACSDPGEPPRLGGLLAARYGKGLYIYTAYSWFRQLPAGVPGAYRVFANLVSGGR